MSMNNEPDFEVTNLRTGLRDERVYEHHEERQQRRRVLSVLAGTLVLVALLLVSFVSVPGFGATLHQALHLPSPTSAQVAVGGDIVYFEHGLPWGSLLLDGKAVTNVDTEQPYTGFEQLYTSMRIPRGRHTLSYLAAPFPPLTCQISVPAAQSDTCPLIRSRGPQDVTPPFVAERVMNLGGDPSFLTASQMGSLVVAVTQAVSLLATSTTIPAGEHFAGTAGAETLAPSPMRAQLSYALATDPASIYTIPGSARNCAVLCVTAAASYTHSTTDQWVVAAHVLPTWTYAMDNGIIIRGSAAPLGVLPDSVVPLSVNWDGVWQVKLADSIASSPMCYIALNLISAEHLTGAPLSTLKMQPATNPADGCLVTGDAVDATGIPRIPFTVMYRFGLLLAVDDEARQLLPALPVADVQMQAMALAWGR
jgi:hypothetical protein